MKKREFLDLLRYYLEDLPEAVVHEILEEYRLHFEEGMRHGKTEEEIAHDLGAPEEIAKEYLHFEDHAGEGPPAQGFFRDSNGRTNWALVVLVVLLFPLWGSLVLAGVSILFAALVTLIACSVAFLVAGGAVFVATLFPSLPSLHTGECFFMIHPMTRILFAAALLALGLLIGRLTIVFFTWLTKKAKDAYLTHQWKRRRALKREELMKKFRAMNGTVRLLLIFAVLALFVLVSFFADSNLDDFSIAFYRDEGALKIGDGGFSLNHRGIFDAYGKKERFSFPLEGVKELAMAAGEIDIAVVASDEDLVEIISDGKVRVREEGERLSLIAKERRVSCRVKTKNPESLDLHLAGGAIELKNEAPLKSLYMGAADVELDSKTDRSYPIRVESAAFEGVVAVRENDYRVDLEGPDVEFQGEEVISVFGRFQKAFGTGRVPLKIDAISIELELK